MGWCNSISMILSQHHCRGVTGSFHPKHYLLITLINHLTQPPLHTRNKMTHQMLFRRYDRLLCLSNKLLFLLNLEIFIQTLRNAHFVLRLKLQSLIWNVSRNTRSLFKWIQKSIATPFPWVVKMRKLRESSNWALLCVQNYCHGLQHCKTLVLYSCNHSCSLRWFFGVIMMKDLSIAKSYAPGRSSQKELEGGADGRREGGRESVSKEERKRKIIL